MTAPSDAQLVSGVLAGDRDAFAQVYDRYADRLHDFAYSMLRHREDAADAVADAFVTTVERLEQLRDPDRLRPWLYAVVRRECLRRLKARSRTAYGGDDELLELPDAAASPETLAEQDSLRSLVWDAAAGLGERDRAMLDLHLRQRLDGAELGEAMGMSADNAYVGLSRLRDQVERSLGALLVARTSREDCTDLSGVLDDWDGEFTPLVRKRVARHVDRCRRCTARRAALASPAALLGGVPAFAAPALLRDRVLEDTRLVSALAARRDGIGGPGGSRGPRGGRGGGPGGGSASRSSRRARRAAAAVLALLLAVVGLVAWQSRADDGQDRVEEVVGEDPGTTATDDPAPSSATETAPTDDVTQVAPPTSTPSPSEVSVSPTDETSPTATEPTATGSEDPTPPAAPGRLVASPRSMDLGTSGGRRVTVTNRGGRTLSWTVDTDSQWLSVSPSSGDLAPGQSRTVNVSARRGELPEGASSGSFTVRWGGGSVPVAVSAARETPPVIGGAAVLGTTCGQGGRIVQVGVPVSDESGVASASMSWTGPTSSGTSALNGSGGQWTAAIGPFPVGGTVRLVVRATDSRDNASQRSPSIQVDPCPQ